MTFILSWIRGMLGGLWGYIAVAGAALLAVLTVYLKGRSAGKNEVRAAAAEKELENAKTGNEVERKVAATKPELRRDELRKYQRD